MTSEVNCYWVNEQAITLQAPPPVSLSQQQRIWTLARSLADQVGILECVPGMNNLTVVFDNALLEGEALMAQLLASWPLTATRQRQGNRVEIPVCYGGEAGPDLLAVARQTGLSPRELVRRHTEVEYTVFFLGFQPGFAYLGGLPAELVCPRRDTPRPMVPAGSVAIGGAQTGVYPRSSPGGWQLIGRTDRRLFDLHWVTPALWQPGDRVRFVIQEACYD